MRIRQKIPLVMLPMVGVGVLLMNAFSQRAVRQVLTQALVRSGQAVSLNLAQKPETVAGFRSGNERLLLPALQQAKESAGALYALVLDPEGRVLAHTNVAETGKRYADEVSAAAIRSDEPGNHTIQIDGQPAIDFSLPVWAAEESGDGEAFLFMGKRDPRARERLGTVRVALPLAETLETADRVSGEVFWIVGLVSVLVLGALLVTLGQFLRPVNQLAQAAERLGRGAVGVTVPEASTDEMGELARSFNRMSRDLAVTTVSRDFLDHILHNVQDILIVTDAGDAIRLVSRRTLALTGYAEEGLIGRPAQQLFPPEDDLAGPRWLDRLGAGAGTASREARLVTACGEPLSVILSLAPYGTSGSERGVILTATDISARKKVEEQLRGSLQEKEILLKEIHHRVKNNLQVISSLLDLQSAQVVDASTRAMLRDSQNRVRSMALVHEQLYRSEDLAQIDLGQYVEVLVRGLFKAQQSDLRRIRLRLETEPVRLAVDRAIPCGLIVNELVSNAFKHAFPDGREGELVVSLRPAAGGGCVLRVKDTGVGFPEGLDCRSSPSLGLKLVDLLVRQVRGRIERRREQGTEFLLELEPA